MVALAAASFAVITINALAVGALDRFLHERNTRTVLERQAAEIATRYAVTRVALGAAVRQEAAQLSATPDPQASLAHLVIGGNELRWLHRAGQPHSASDRPVFSGAWPTAPGVALVDWRGGPYLVTSAPVAGTAWSLVGALELGAQLAPRNGASYPRVALAAGDGDGAAQSVVLDRTDAAILRAELAAPGDGTTRWSLVALAGMNVALLVALFTLARWLGRRGSRQAVALALAPLQNALIRARRGDPDPMLLVPPQHPIADIAATYNDVVTAYTDRLYELEHQRKYDALTGLATRAEVRERIATAVARAQADESSVAAVLMDTARFGEINSTFGQEAGDKVLKILAQRLARVTRVGDVAARVGGDEFMLLLGDVDAEQAQAIVSAVVTTLSQPVELEGKNVSLALRAGIALYPQHAETAHALRRMANIALMSAKENRSELAMFEPGQDEQHLRELAIIHDLPKALRDGELYLQYQPKIDMQTQRVDTVEALVRWRHPQLGFVPPDEFIGLLERAGQIAPLTRWVVGEAIRQCGEWTAAGYDLGVAVNISANDLLDETLPGSVVEQLRKHAVDVSRLSIEVTESAVIADPERAIGVLNTFKRAGIKIALDDFGTGQTSLSLLKQLPLSQVKIDKSFVQHLRADSGDAIIVKSIIDLGHNMGLLVTAEGVESNYCWNLLNSYNCDLVQGYLVSAPLTADELRKWYLKLQKRHVTELDYDALKGSG